MAEGDITIITTIHPAKNGRRPITVAAAAEGELPTLLNGAFPDRHALADQAYGVVLKAQAAAAAKASKKKAAGKAAKPKHKIAPAEATAAPADQTLTLDASAGVGPDGSDQETPSPTVKAPGDLPVIEGDHNAQLELEGVDG